MSGLDHAMLRAMRHSPVHNYIVPGLTSWLIGAPSPQGTMRLLECSRAHEECVTPHSHRFDFQCWVLSGHVLNRIWTPDSAGDAYAASILVYEGLGKYVKQGGAVGHWSPHDASYDQGSWYSMKASQVHSIFFSKGAEVLFFEGPQVSDNSLILEPVVDGELIPTFEVKPWMFRRGPALAQGATNE